MNDRWNVSITTRWRSSTPCGRLAPCLSSLVEGLRRTPARRQCPPAPLRLLSLSPSSSFISVRKTLSQCLPTVACEVTAAGAATNPRHPNKKKIKLTSACGEDLWLSDNPEWLFFSPTLSFFIHHRSHRVFVIPSNIRQWWRFSRKDMQ